ncbi:hypothetical protein ACOSP7_010607 [Xanthoceras sorbifolium]
MDLHQRSMKYEPRDTKSLPFVALVGARRGGYLPSLVVAPSAKNVIAPSATNSRLCLPFLRCDKGHCTTKVVARRRGAKSLLNVLP